MEHSVYEVHTKSRRFSASNLKSFRDDERCLRSTTTISSTPSSPGYIHATRDKIDPSTYSFTSALKALQAKAVYSWEYLPSHSYRLTLHSKWSDAEKYISNPQSGEVPLECLSVKALSARPLTTNRISISAPLLYQTNYSLIRRQHKLSVTIQEKTRCTSGDVETQITSADVGSAATPSPLTTTSIQERLKKNSEGEFGDSSVSIDKQKSEAEVEEREAKEKECRRGREGKKKMVIMVMCREGGVRKRYLSLKGLWKRVRDKCKSRKNSNPSSSPTLRHHINACFESFDD